MPCRFPGPHPGRGGSLRGPAGGTSPGPHTRGKLRGLALRGGLQAYMGGEGGVSQHQTFR